MITQAGYPGVYIREVPSGVRTIIGASTSNLAILGAFARGPVNEAFRVNNWGDFERTFGGLDRRSDASYALYDFFQQGGSTAFVVRIAFAHAEVTLTTTEPAMVVQARAGGVAGNDVRVGFSHNADGTFDMAVSPSDAAHDAGTEVFRGLSLDPGSRDFVESRVNAPRTQGGSALVTVSGTRHRPAVTNAGTSAADLARADLTALAPGTARTGASRTLQSGGAPSLTLSARAEGGAGNAVRYAVRHNGASNFDLLVRGDGTSAPELFTDLSTDGNAATFAEAVVNQGAAGAASQLLTVAVTPNAARPDEQLPAGFDPAADLGTIQYADMTPLEGGRDETAAAFSPLSEPIPALTLQSKLSGDAGNALTAAVAVNGSAFTLTVGTETFSNLVLDPLSDRFVLAVVNGSSNVGVITGRHPLRQPGATTSAVAFRGGGSTVPSASATIASAGGGPALRVVAANPGTWGNALRVGFGASPGGGFDLVVREYRGTEAASSEIFRGLNAIPDDPRNAADVLRASSNLVRIEDLAANPPPSDPAADAGDLPRDALVPLGGGGDGVRPGDPAWASGATTAFIGEEAARTGINALDGIVPEIFNIMIIPEAPSTGDQGMALYAAAAAYCDRELAFLLVDHPERNDDARTITGWNIAGNLGTNLARSAALCFPRVMRADRLAGGRQRRVPASGSVAGVMARIDSQRGVWKAPAGLDASVSGANPSVKLTDLEQGRLNKLGLNCLRAFPNVGTVHWGARTLAGADATASEWKYVPVRRTALFIERSLKTALPWVVFEPNDEPLWSQIRLNVGSFMQSLFVQGAFQGLTPDDAYLVRCDAETTSQQDVNSGIVNILVGFAPLKPAEFVVLHLQQLAGRLAA